MGDGRKRDRLGRLAPATADDAELDRRSAIRGPLSGGPKKRPARRGKAARAAGRPAAPVIWSGRLEAAFCAELAETLNVRAAAARIGVSEGSVRSRRERSPGLRRLWRAAIREGYQQLELKLLERALKGAPADGTDKDFCQRTAMALLARWKGSVQEEPREERPAARVTREALRERFRDMRARLAATGQDDDPQR